MAPEASKSGLLSSRTSGRRQIPECEFVEDIASFVKQYDSVDDALRQIEIMVSKYRFMEQNLEQQRAQLVAQMPELRKSLDMVLILQEKAKNGEEQIDFRYELSDSVHASARIKKLDKVVLSIGCGVLVEYTLDEALELLNDQIQRLNESLTDYNTDLAYLERQITTASVTLSRVYNYGVSQERGEKSE